MSGNGSTPGRVLVAGVGNVFLSDDGFGVAVVEQLQRRGGLPAGVELVDSGIRGVHLAYRLLDGYRALVIVDATQRGGQPGTVYTLEHDLDGARDETGAEVPALDGHGMDPAAVLTLLDGLASSMGLERPVERVFVVGCEPAVLDEGIGLSPAVVAAVEPGVRAVTALVKELMIDEGVSR
ncbi:hydrogenase maturation protease [Pseudonocardia yunnanensis]|uniref:Hydrogenase maturation protease n=1 Tax=Pseudonocardia yunnanensis TaxID=58107 RepID=A0ABW4F5Z3_9PSEU